MGRVIDRIKELIAANPLAWLGLAAFLFAEYQLYQRGGELTEACEYVTVLAEALLEKGERLPDGRAARICARRLAEPDIEP